jgi:hypothetical protein
VHGEQPARWYELRPPGPGANLKRLLEDGGFVSMAAIRELPEMCGAAGELRETKNSKHSLQDEKLRRRARSALKKEEQAHRSLRVVLVSQR